MSEENKDAERAAFEAWRLEKFCAGVERLKKCSNAPDVYYYSAEQEAWKVWKARASLPVSVPDGWKLVPIKPDIEMVEAGYEAVLGQPDRGGHARVIEQYDAMLAAAPTVKAEQVDVCDTCHGQGEVYSGHDQHFHYFDFQPPEPIMDVCPECGGEEAPSLPAAGSAVEGVEVRGLQWLDTGHYRKNPPQFGYNPHDWNPLMTVAQHERIVAALSAQQSAQPEFYCKHSYKVAKQAAWDARDLTHCKCDHNEYCEHCWPDDFKEGGKWYNGFEAQQSAPERVSVPRDLLADLISSDHDTKIQAERALYALLASHAEGGKV
ncbi:hypothetical protein EQ826_15560 [Ectopseudomonas mendocina]|nr:hypothetical protein [Pseudomonas mendocina]TRO24874.1 hypothetical protein EQ826_15560 [Pseudomonas mendocina]